MYLKTPIDPIKSQQRMVEVKMLFMPSIITEKEYHNSFKDKPREFNVF